MKPPFSSRVAATRMLAALVVLIPAVAIAGTFANVMMSTAAEAKRTKAERQADRAINRVERARERADRAQGRANAAEERVQQKAAVARERIRALPPKPKP